MLCSALKTLTDPQCVLCNTPVLPMNVVLPHRSRNTRMESLGTSQRVEEWRGREGSSRSGWVVEILMGINTLKITGTDSSQL